MRYVQIQHRYVVPVPDAAPSDPEWDSLCNSAVTIMEQHMKKLNPNMQDLATAWETMPNEFAPIQSTAQTGTAHRGRNISPEEAEARGGQVSFVDDVMGGVGGVTHPHDVGQRFFPPDHPLYDAETEVIEGEVVRDEDDKPKELDS